MTRRLSMLLFGLFAIAPLPASQAKPPLPLTLGIEVEWERERTGRESRRLEMEKLVREEFEEKGCFERLADSPEEAELRLVVRLREFSLSQDAGGVSRIDERSGEFRAGRSYECRIDLIFALLPPGEGDPLHVDDFLVANREATTSNPLWDPRYQAERRATEMAVRELRRRVCRRGSRILKELSRRETKPSAPSR